MGYDCGMGVGQPRRFAAIEGLRGWLAWTVVFSHIAQATNIYALGLGPLLIQSGPAAVLVFMVISGFVITHLIVERQESYGVYIWRRWLRIFPLFAITCLIGFFTSRFYLSAALSVPEWQPESFLTTIQDISRSTHAHLWAHVIAHLTMMHGAISNNILPYSQYAFNPPAWSLSLEWQFYLVAPLMVYLARSWPLIRICLATALIVLFYSLGAFGSFESPSFLPGALPYFIIGIMWRLHFTKLTLSATDRTWCQRLFESRIMLYFGARSYSIYLIHYPILSVLFWLIVPRLTMSKPLAFIALTCAVIPATILMSEILYRCIELPSIAIGKKRIYGMTSTTIGSAPSETVI